MAVAALPGLGAPRRVCGRPGRVDQHSLAALSGRPTLGPLGPEVPAAGWPVQQGAGGVCGTVGRSVTVVVCGLRRRRPGETPCGASRSLATGLGGAVWLYQEARGGLRLFGRRPRWAPPVFGGAGLDRSVVRPKSEGESSWTGRGPPWEARGWTLGVWAWVPSPPFGRPVVPRVLRHCPRWGRVRGRVPGTLLRRAASFGGLSPLPCVADLLARGGRFVSAGVC